MADTTPDRDSTIELDGFSLSIEDVIACAHGAQVELAQDARSRISRGRQAIEQLLKRDHPVYGVNTGFGLLADVRISGDQVEELQLNLLRSHAAGVGAPLPIETARAIMLLRANVMATGHSGVRVRTLEALIDLLNHNVVPVIPRWGSVGASGDLAPLSHLALVLVGEGEAWLDGQRLPGLLALKRAGLEPIRLQAKEGLSLVNGTQVMTAMGCDAWTQSVRLAKAADAIGAMTVEVLLGTPHHFDARIMQLRPHPGAIACGDNLRALLAESEIAASHAQSDHKVQDPYSLRCMPQVHGSVRDSLAHVEATLRREINAVTDNPLVCFGEDGSTPELISAGNFHGQPVASVLDYLGAAVATLGTISERRTEQMVNPRESGLPAFLANDPGLESGFMMPHVTAAALVAHNRVLAHPASTDTIPTSGGQEDHVSMGVTSASKSQDIVENTARILAIELLAATRGLDLRQPLTAGKGAQVVYEAAKEDFGTWSGDRPTGEKIETVQVALRAGWMEKALVKAGIKLH